MDNELFKGPQTFETFVQIFELTEENIKEIESHEEFNKIIQNGLQSSSLRVTSWENPITQQNCARSYFVLAKQTNQLYANVYDFSEELRQKFVDKIAVLYRTFSSWPLES